MTIGRLSRIPAFHVSFVPFNRFNFHHLPLLQEGLAIDAVLAHRSCLPSKVGAAWVALKTGLIHITTMTTKRRQTKRIIEVEPDSLDNYWNLEKQRLARLVPAADEEGHSKRPHLLN